MSEAIKSQIEFYFSDSNFRKDTFLRAAVESDPDGFVPISVLLTFNKLKKLTTDPDVVVSALQDSTSVLVSEDGKKVKRTTPLGEVDTSAERTLYVKGYPLEDSDVNIEFVKSQFEKFGKVLLVKLRRDNQKRFKGSCFIEFETEDSVKKAFETANEGGEMKLFYKDTPFLCIIPFKTWFENKQSKLSARKNDNNSNKRKSEVLGDAEIESEEKKFTHEKGLLVKIGNLPSDSSGVKIKEFLKTISDVRYVDYNNGDSFAIVRPADLENSEKLKNALTNEVKFPETNEILQNLVISEEEEATFWGKSSIKSKIPSKNKKFGGKGRGNKRQRY